MSAGIISLQRAARHNVLASTGVVLVTIFVICSLFAPGIAPQDPAHIDLGIRLR
jgi:ABC-type dipeptide/oligopeptide/nickel transport system permease subunit